MTEPNECECSSHPTLIFACSGAADVGEVSDLAARKLNQDGAGKMFCLAGVGGRIGGILDKTLAADQILALDGCSLDCARLTLEKAGLRDFAHVRLTDLGLEKGKTEVGPDSVSRVVVKAKSLLKEAGSKKR